MSSSLRLLVSVPLIALAFAGCGGSTTDQPKPAPTASSADATRTTEPPAPVTLELTSGELVAKVAKLLPKVAPGTEAIYVIAAEAGGDGPKIIDPAVRTSAEAALRKRYRLPTLRLVDTDGQGIACGVNEIANAAGDGVPFGLGLVADVVDGQAWLARSSDMCMAVAYDHKDPAAVGASPTGRVIGRVTPSAP